MDPLNDINWQQADFIYDLKRCSVVDNDFIDYISYEARAGSFIWPHKIHRPLKHAINLVNFSYNTNFSLEYGRKKLKLMEQRYKTFSWLVRLDNVNYEPSTNVVTASNAVWRSIIQRDRFARAYLYEGEPKFEELTVIYAPYVDNVVVVSSDDETEKQQNGLDGKEFVLIDEDVGTSTEGGPAHIEDGVVVALPAYNQVNNDAMGNEMAIVPYINREAPAPAPLEAIPPLDMIEISSGTSESSLFNWWEQLELMDDKEGSMATDASTANSFTWGVLKGNKYREYTSRYAHRSPVKPSIHLSSTASNSPLGKPPRSK